MTRIPIPLDFHAQYTITNILNDYGDRVSIDGKSKTLGKFGRNDAVGTSFEQVWKLGGLETLPTDNVIDQIVSTDAGDDMMVRIEGHTIDEDDNFAFVVQNVILNGLVPVLLPTPLARATRMFNNSGTSFAGTVSVSDGGVTNYLQSAPEDNQSLKCATTISSVDYWIIDQLIGSVTRQNSRSVDFKLQIAESGKIFRTRFPFSVHSQNGTVIVNLTEPIIVPPNSDVRMLAISSGADTGVTAFIGGYLASIIE